jgi:hypothetical protein
MKQYDNYHQDYPESYHLAFSLTWWTSHSPNVASNTKSSITMMYYSALELMMINHWCVKHHIYDGPHLVKFEDYLDPLFTEKFNIDRMWHQINQLVVHGSTKQLGDLHKFLSSIPIRKYELIVKNITHKEIANICEGSNYLIISDGEAENTFGVSTDSKNAVFELTLRAHVHYT